jgi:L,D-peptidoglycan transpeptidase YkuD (ErfK/YbiS/YcfS/YnhG family)
LVSVVLLGVLFYNGTMTKSIFFLLIIGGVIVYLSQRGDDNRPPPPAKPRSIGAVLDYYSPLVEPRLKRVFAEKKLSYPPANIALLAVKSKKTLELWAEQAGRWHYVKTWDIQAASGRLGPKLREGDRQVPEGIYKVLWLNPNSSYHLSMKLDYPNAFDQQWAEKEGRDKPGSDIFIHGKALSAGCLAMGDPAIEELFTLSERVGVNNITVVIAPVDPRHDTLTVKPDDPPWVHTLYKNIETTFLTITNS